MSVIFIVMPKVEQYVFDSESRHMKDELQRVTSVVHSKSKELETYSQMSLQNHKNRIKDVSQVGINIIKSYDKKFKNGELTFKKAKKLAYKDMNNIKYGQNDYFYTLNRDGVLIQHPDKRFLGLSLYDRPDERGNFFAQELMKESYENGSAYTRYWWVRDKENEIIEKLTYTTYYKPWDIYISTGLYIDDIQKTIDIQSEKIKKELDNIISSIKFARTGYVYVTSSDEKTIISPKVHINNKDILEVSKLKEAFNGSKEIVFYKKRGKSKEEKFAIVDYDKFYDWYIVAAIYKQDLYYKAKEISFTILSISFLVLFFLFVVGMNFIKRLIYPIELLSKDALEIQQGNLSIRNKIKTNDELGVLAEQFNYMVNSIEDNVKNLEEKVEIRTRELNDKLHHDDLTKLKNKYALLKDLKNHESATLIVVDIESFDDINELYSYGIGNTVLIEYSKLLLRFCMNKSYEVYRIYGNTFALLDKDDLINIMKYENDIKELTDINRDYVVKIEEQNLEIDIDSTLGIAIMQDNALKKANNALKNAKKTHKRYVVYNSSLDIDSITENIKVWRERIKDAIEHDLITPFYQPIYNRDNKIEKYETLMRMKEVSENNEVKYVSPFFFLDIATKTKQYARLSEIVIRKSLQFAKEGTHSVSINLGFSDIEDPNILNMLDEYFNKDTEEFCKRVVFEILESDHITDYEIFEEFIFKYRALGLRFAIDDFGTGYSNFTHILTVRPDYLKIDGSLIKNVHEDKDSLELVKSIIRFSQELHIKTIAEYVHNKEVYDIVYDLGVDEFQGYYLDEPKVNI
jgi:EAL domain-containing protein (putative c-di-GMP-specific phosphodiesterase class I)/GGDEF domain-containing protein/HAMP domain-containing protein